MRRRDWIQKLKRRANRGQSDEEAGDAPTDSPTALGIATHDTLINFTRDFISTPRTCSNWPWGLYMAFLPSAGHLTEGSYSHGLKWMAVLAVKANDLPALMECGIHLPTATLETHGGDVRRLSRVGASHFLNLRMLVRRRYTFSGPGRRPSQEHSSLVVYARGVRELSEFDARHLSARNVTAAVGFDAKGETVYRFSSVDPQDNLNALCGDEPMEGLWPWPRATEAG